MSCIEVVAEFKDKCQYIIASPEEVPSNGIIDTKSMSFLMSDSSLSNRLLFLCNNFKFKFLDYKKEVSLALIKTDNIVTLMDEIKRIHPEAAELVQMRHGMIETVSDRAIYPAAVRHAPSKRIRSVCYATPINSMSKMSVEPPAMPGWEYLPEPISAGIYSSHWSPTCIC